MRSPGDILIDFKLFVVLCQTCAYFSKESAIARLMHPTPTGGAGTPGQPRITWEGLFSTLFA
jgi:hypothetical protein